MQLTGTFMITDWQEQPQKELTDSSKLTKAAVRQTYSGDISGDSEVHYQMHYTPEGNAKFCGFEYVAGHINNHSCHLVLQIQGEFKQGVASGRFTIISVESDDDALPELLTGANGEFMSAENGQANYRIAPDVTP